MNAITLTEPWATLVVTGEKRIETRRFRPRAVQPGSWLFIHAARTMTRHAVRTCYEPLFARALARHGGGTVGGVHVFRAFDLGAIIGAVRFMGAIDTETIMATQAERWRPNDPTDHLVALGWPMPLTLNERIFGDYGPGRVGWLLKDPKRLTQPVPCRGQLGIWVVPERVRAEVIRNLGGAGLELTA